MFLLKIKKISIMISRNGIYYAVHNNTKYYFVASYRDAMPAKKKKNPSNNTTKSDQVYKSPKPIRNKVN